MGGNRQRGWYPFLSELETDIEKLFQHQNILDQC